MTTLDGLNGRLGKGTAQVASSEVADDRQVGAFGGRADAAVHDQVRRSGSDERARTATRL